MDRTRLLATAGALALTATGAVSALFLTVGAADSGTASSPSTEIVEYVDAAGNPIPASQAGTAATTAPDAPSTDAYDGGEPDDESDHEEADDHEENDHEEGGEHENEGHDD